MESNYLNGGENKQKPGGVIRQRNGINTGKNVSA